MLKLSQIKPDLIWKMSYDIKHSIDGSNKLNPCFDLGVCDDESTIIRLLINRIPLLGSGLPWSYNSQLFDEQAIVNFCDNLITIELVMDVSDVILSRCLAMLPALAILNSEELKVARGASIVIALGDLGHNSSLCFSGNICTSQLLPDPYFFLTNGYCDFKFILDKSWVSFEHRFDKVYWRGATSGVCPNHTFINSQRARFIRFANKLAPKYLYDLKFTKFVCSDVDRQVLENEECVTHADPPIFMMLNKYNVDVDGNSNSWPGLYQKLLSGSPVLKIQSDSNHSQWYYDKLKPWVNYVPISSDFSDFEESVLALVKNQDLAKSIGYAGRELVMDMNPQTEYKYAKEILFSRILEDHDKI